jgi:hypothetical protein
VLPAALTRSRNLMRHSYIVWSRVSIHGCRSGSRDGYALVLFGILDVDFLEFIF